MPPKKAAVESADPPAPSTAEEPVEEKDEAKSGAAALRKLVTHPSTAVMVQEALKELDSRKGVSSQAIQNYIKQKYPSVDSVRLKTLVRKALKKGIESGTLVRPANATVTTGAMGKFRLAPKVKESKPKSENADPNVQKAPKAAKDGAKKPKKTGATKKKDTASGEAKSTEASKPPKKSNKDDPAASKAAPAKKPKTKKTEVDGEATSDPTETAETTKTKAAKTTKKGEKTGKATQSKAAKAGEAPASKTTGKRGKKPAD